MTDPALDALIARYGLNAGYAAEVFAEAPAPDPRAPFRARGHLAADLDPLGLEPREAPPAVPAGEDGARLLAAWCGTLGAEVAHVEDPALRAWLEAAVEEGPGRSGLDGGARRALLAQLLRVEAFEAALLTRYPGHKGFSLSGGDAAVTFLDRVFDRAAAAGVREAVLGMPHRGRLAVMACTLGKPAARIFETFEDRADPGATHGSGDLRYHLGASALRRSWEGGGLAVTLAPNPSHLEAVDPVVEGMARARQRLAGAGGAARVLPVLLHGDASFPGQGVVAETLNLAGLEGYATGGTLHLVVDNRVGFTAGPERTRSTRRCTDLAKAYGFPILHVNGDDPEAAVRAADLAFDARQRFGADVVVRLVCYRRFGHNEGDEPRFTLPLLYRRIDAHPPVAAGYAARLEAEGVLAPGEAEVLRQRARGDVAAGPASPDLPPPQAPVLPPAAPADLAPRLREAARALGRVPAGFQVHPKLVRLQAARAAVAEGGPVDWAGAELLAFGLCLQEGLPVRLSGQDAVRGTFSQRHLTLFDVRNGAPWTPLAALAPGLEALDSPLSEFAVLGFEFGYATADPAALVLWEAQFGDFANGAQVILDQFLAASERKWGQEAGLVLLLPHGQEGQGPEHSSARLERLLDLCAEDNLRVAQPSTAAQHFHLLRRQARDPRRRPLAVLTPKGLLRDPATRATLADLAAGGFQGVLDDPAFAAGEPRAGVERVALVSGKLGHELLRARQDRRTAILRLEQLYPFPAGQLSQALAGYPRSAVRLFAQEEPRNMGAWRYVRERLGASACDWGCVARPERASPAPGSRTRFLQEQAALVTDALNWKP
ncbi:multifunctional oxoglutarate decarboxylase/oxoglutarate dehydrogenase thiamine pyrophosphate-binding subunit/dihydrolipoyllysine-residue succinyltransferase subunit [Mesoterricola sediminis]|uniref:oxoglutarate dehydrogenase (succinyl-transferring) n=1 Tax=Mesoterricola sediminis TaxID=2927980 RepID=A0AA48GW45_9BACT|nr:multifunctional oxoglutarate decarboxylase/oxoglutarate dehydrogenase thiamine pyrophosphate-binding subunit/dihydrolipoyllysine-residue succinyltransferase subunit [Mesoterricola sediminis]BDU75167.1 hypothetical protein METESE_01250 [Mesoterricola sediminis]